MLRLAASAFVLTLAANAPADEPFGDVPPTTNPHHSGRHCELCHDSVPEPGGGPSLRFGHDDRSNCRCHFEAGVGYPHPVEIEPSAELLERIPAAYPLFDGRVTCETCHDVAQQCSVRSRGRAFLRGGPYPHPKQMCFSCHDPGDYERRDPHVQLDENGALVEESCLYCHESVPDPERSHFEDVTYVADMEALCRRCHRHELHPGGVEHHVAPSAKSLARIHQLEAEYATLMPLTVDGELTCVTCHNPHQEGVLPAHLPAARGAGAPRRHRVADICSECHLK